jgi:hypothetical protein
LTPIRGTRHAGAWRDGTAVRETRATLVQPTGGTLRREIATDLVGLAPGDYLLELRVHDQTTGRDLNAREPLTIAAAPPHLSAILQC